MSTTAGRITEALFGRIRRELLSILLLNPERPFFLLELVALLRTGRGGVQRELASLLESGLALRERDGSRTYYRAVSEAPAVAELTALLRTAAEPLRLLREFSEERSAEIVLAHASPPSIDASGRPVLELLVAGGIPATELRGGLERLELLTGSRIREVLVSPDDLPVFLAGRRGTPWLEPEGGTLLRGSWPESSAVSPDPFPEPAPDLFTSMGLAWEE